MTTPLSRALEMFEKRYGFMFSGTIYEELKGNIKSFISDFYRQILTEDIERLLGEIDKRDFSDYYSNGERTLQAMQDGHNQALESEISHKKQLLKELE